MPDVFLSLFYWMSHVGSGRDERLFDALCALKPTLDSEKVRKYCRQFLASLLRCGQVVRPEGRDSSWRMYPSTFVLRKDGSGAFWRGGLSPHLLEQARALAGDRLFFQPPGDQPSPPSVFISGGCEELKSLAAALYVRFETDAARRAVAAAPAISEGCRLSELPTTHKTFLTPIEPESPRAIYRFNPPKSQRRYFIVDEKVVFEMRNEPDAIYFAARGYKRLCHYDQESHEIIAQKTLSIAYALPLYLCSGKRPIRKDSGLVYLSVPPDIGRFILHQLGQDAVPPAVRWF